MNETTTTNDASKLALPLEAWVLLDTLLYRLEHGGFGADEIPGPVVRTDCSAVLDRLEEKLYAEPLQDPAGMLAGDSREALWKEWGGVRLSRFLGRDNAELLAGTLRSQSMQTMTPERRWRWQQLHTALAAVLPPSPTDREARPSLLQ